MLRAGGSDCGGALTRLYVVCCKGLTEDTLACMFRAFPGLEYCDLKRDHLTGQSRVRPPGGSPHARFAPACSFMHACTSSGARAIAGVPMSWQWQNEDHAGATGPPCLPNLVCLHTAGGGSPVLSFFCLPHAMC